MKVFDANAFKKEKVKPVEIQKTPLCWGFLLPKPNL